MVGDASKLGWHPWILGIYPSPTLKLRVRTWKWMVGILVFFWGLANLQGRTVHPENCGRCLLYPFWWTRRLFQVGVLKPRVGKVCELPKWILPRLDIFWIIAVSLVGKILRDREMDGRAASLETDDMTHIRHIHGGRERNHIRAVLARKLPKAKISWPGTRIQHILLVKLARDLTCDLGPQMVAYK